MKSLAITTVLTLVYVIDRASSSMNEHCGNAVLLGRRHYAKSIMREIGIINHIVIDNDDNIFFRKAFVRNIYVWKKGASSPVGVQGIEGVGIDSAINDEGKVFFATTYGLYQYEPTSGGVTYKNEVTEANQMTIGPNGTFYFTEESGGVYFMSPNATNWSPLQVIDNGLSLAVNSKGDIYYTNKNDNHNYVLLNGHMEAIKILGIRAETTLLMVIDKRDDILYICTAFGLYWLEPGTYHPQRIPGFNEVYSMGFDRHGNVIIADDVGLYKLTLLAADPCITTTSTEVTETFLKLTTEAYKDEVTPDEVTPDEHVAPLNEAGSPLVLRWWFWVCSIGVITTCNMSVFILYNKVKATRRNRVQLRSNKERNYDQNSISLKDKVGYQPTSSAYQKEADAEDGGV